MFSSFKEEIFRERELCIFHVQYFKGNDLIALFFVVLHDKILILIFTALETQVEELRADVERENKLTPQLDEDTKRFHRQFTINRSNYDRYIPDCHVFV